MSGRSAFRMLPWLLGSLIAVLMAWQDVLRLDGLVVAHSVVWGRDFANMWTGGRIAAAGRLDMLYDLQAYGVFQDALFGPIRQHTYSYPPPSLFLCVPLSLLPYGVALAAWLAATGAVLLAVLNRHFGELSRTMRVAALLTPAATINIWDGQYGFLAGALFLAAGLDAKRAPVRAGAFAALLTIKPHMGVLLPLLFVWQRRWKAILWSAIFTALLVVASGLVFGWQPWLAFLHIPGTLTSLLGDEANFFVKMMPTVFVATRVLGLPVAIGWALQGVAAAAAILCCYKVVRAGAAEADIWFVAATATFLVIPYGFNYDMTAADIGVAIMLERHWSGLSIRDRAILIAGFVAPQLIILTGFFGAPVGPLLMAATLFVQAKLACEDGRKKRAGAEVPHRPFTSDSERLRPPA